MKTFNVDDLVHLRNSDVIHRVDKVDDNSARPRYFVDGKWRHPEALSSIGLMEGKGPIKLQVTMPTAGLTDEQIQAKTEDFLGKVKDVIAASGLDPDAIKIESVTHINDGM